MTDGGCLEAEVCLSRLAGWAGKTRSGGSPKRRGKVNQEKKKAQEDKQISRIRLSGSSELVATIVDNEKLDLRIWIDTEEYKGPTKKRTAVLPVRWDMG